MAAVGLVTSRASALARSAAQSSCWSPQWPRPRPNDSLTQAAFRARSEAYNEALPGANRSPRRCQRPCSTQLTGIVSCERAATSTVVLSTRFCLAPTSSSPSSSKSGRSARFVTLRADTTPSWSTSVTTAASLASVSVSQSGSARPEVRRGIHVRAPERRGSLGVRWVSRARWERCRQRWASSVISCRPLNGVVREQGPRRPVCRRSVTGKVTRRRNLPGRGRSGARRPWTGSTAQTEGPCGANA